MSFLVCPRAQWPINLFRHIANLELADLNGGQGQNDEAKCKQAGDGDPWRDRIGDDGEEGHYAFRWNRDRAEILEVEGHTEFLQQGGKDRVKGLPYEDDGRSNHGVLEQKAEG